MTSLPNSRFVNGLLFAGTVFLMSTALVFQHVMGLEPCILCITQRVVVILVGIVALAAAIHNPGARGVRVYGGVTAAVALCGAGVAGRQVYLQSLPPDQVPACGPSLEYMLEVFPLTEVLEMVFMGEGNCAEVLWTFLGLSIPGWTLVAFTGMLLLAITQVVWPR